MLKYEPITLSYITFCIGSSFTQNFFPLGIVIYTMLATTEFKISSKSQSIMVNKVIQLSSLVVCWPKEIVLVEQAFTVAGSRFRKSFLSVCLLCSVVHVILSQLMNYIFQLDNLPLVLYCAVLYLYIFIALLAVHTNQKRFQCERPRERRAVLRERKEALDSPVFKQLMPSVSVQFDWSSLYVFLFRSWVCCLVFVRYLCGTS